MEKYVDLQVMDINILRQFSMTMEVLADVFQGDALKPARHRIAHFGDLRSSPNRKELPCKK